MNSDNAKHGSNLIDFRNTHGSLEMSEVIQTRTACIHLRFDGVIYSELLPNAEVTLDDAIANVKACVLLAGLRELPVLVKFGNVKSLSREARQYLVGKETARNTSASAIVISSSVGKVIGNFMIGFNKTLYPIRIFTTEDEAIEWLKGFAK